MARAAIRLVVMMVRPPVTLVLLLFAALGLGTAGAADGFHPLFTTVLVVVGGWFVNATVLNDLADKDIDRINLANARGGPLVSGDASRAELLALGIGAGLVALVVGTAVDWRVGAVVAAGLALNAAYSVPPVGSPARGRRLPAAPPGLRGRPLPRRRPDRPAVGRRPPARPARRPLRRLHRTDHAQGLPRRPG